MSGEAPRLRGKAIAALILGFVAVAVACIALVDNLPQVPFPLPLPEILPVSEHTS